MVEISPGDTFALAMGLVLAFAERFVLMFVFVPLLPQPKAKNPIISIAQRDIGDLRLKVFIEEFSRMRSAETAR